MRRYSRFRVSGEDQGAGDEFFQQFRFKDSGSDIGAFVFGG